MLEPPFAIVEGEEILLSAPEYKLLEYLVGIKNQPVSKEKLSIRVLGDSDPSNLRRILDLMKSLKKKFDQHGVPPLVRTIPTWGFMLVTDKRKFLVLDTVYTAHGGWKDRHVKYGKVVHLKGGVK